LQFISIIAFIVSQFVYYSIGGSLVKRKKVKNEGIDVLSHVLVPEMKILSTEEKNRVLKKYNVTKWQLPKLLASDSAVVALKASVDDIVEINRNDLTGKSLCYKLVIDG